MTAPIHLTDVLVQGSKVLLAPPLEADAEAVFGMLHGRREILDWIEWQGPRDVDDLREKARHWRTLGGCGGANYHLAIHGVVDGLRGPPVGAISLRFVDHPGRGDVGYWIGREHQRRGYASEALEWAAWLAFEALQAERLSACVFEGNEVSARVLLRSGFRELVPTAECAASGGCGRAKTSFELPRAAWEARADRQRPSRVELAFDDARP